MKIKTIFIIIFISIVFTLGFFINVKNDDTNNYEIERIDLITCTINDLLTVPGIGESKANNIIDYRSKFSFSKKEELMNVKGIGKSTYENIKNYFYLSKKTIKINNKKININNADANLLISLPGIGQVTANKIIDYRKIKVIESIDDLKNIGINKNVINSLEGMIEF